MRRMRDPLERFDLKWKLDPDTGCHVWTKANNGVGYGVFYADGKMHLAHRWRWELDNGPVPKGMVLDHFKCSNRGCANQAHVRPVSQRENLLRGEGATALNAAKTHCPQGHEYTEDNIYWHKDGSRDCKKCRTERRREQTDRERRARCAS